jgi:hypothetical protein
MTSVKAFVSRVKGFGGPALSFAQDPVGRRSRRGETDTTSLAGSRRI